LKIFFEGVGALRRVRGGVFESEFSELKNEQNKNAKTTNHANLIPKDINLIQSFPVKCLFFPNQFTIQITALLGEALEALSKPDILTN